MPRGSAKWFRSIVVLGTALTASACDGRPEGDSQPQPEPALPLGTRVTPVPQVHSQSETPLVAEIDAGVAKLAAAGLDAAAPLDAARVGSTDAQADAIEPAAA
jgi:hypothetical protein